jgi:hypothetical protein
MHGSKPATRCHARHLLFVVAICCAGAGVSTLFTVVTWTLED